MEFFGHASNDYEKMDATLRGRFFWLWEHDLGQDVEEAMRYLRSLDVVQDST